MKIYLAGPINGCTDAEAMGWREQAKKLHPNVLDPMYRDYRGQEEQEFSAIVEADKRDIENCDGVLVYFEKPSVGTSMEVLFAWERNKPVVIVDKSNRPISPWLRYHSVCICYDIQSAIKILENKKGADPAANAIDA